MKKPMMVPEAPPIATRGKAGKKKMRTQTKERPLARKKAKGGY